ncbi:uncharacterized protein LOC130049948 [Ostrea edulis]|uniref:uncharacterized protein LOC130049948 n=1 Tax=Ostrea edulis TaxID=37623 RepID=UPI0024AFEA66|nr:uncharacterized protein LOC130049948 [Ostrea edulis]
MSLNQEAKEKAWLENYERVLNVEFDWDPEHLTDEPPLEGPPVPITIDMVKKAISKTKSGKAAGPSGIAVEMIRAAGDTGVSMIRDLASSIVRGGAGGKVPTNWEQSFIVCLYKGKGDALDRSNYRGLKRTEQVMKVLERMWTASLGINKRFCMGFVNLEKAFDRVPQKMIWWALRKLSVEAWIVRLVQEMYANARSCVRR